jgi:hypothetical protein
MIEVCSQQQQGLERSIKSKKDVSTQTRNGPLGRVTASQMTTRRRPTMQKENAALFRSFVRENERTRKRADASWISP